MVDLILKGLLVFSVVSYGTKGMILDIFDLLFFRIGIIILFTASLFDIPKRIYSKHTRWAIGFLLCLVVISTFQNNFHNVIISNSINLFLGCLAIHIISVYCKNPDSCAKWLTAGAIINILAYVSQQLGFNPILNKPGYIGCEGAILASITRLTLYLAIILPFLLNFHWALFLAAIGLSIYSKQYSLLFPAFLILFIKAEMPRLKFLLVILMGLSIYLFHAHLLQSILFRWKVAWNPSITVFFTKPLLGYGFGILPIPDSEVAANDFIQLFVGLGLGSIAWVIYILKTHWKFLKTDLASLGIITLISQMMIEYPFEVPRLWITIIFLIAYFIIKSQEAKCQY